MRVHWINLFFIENKDSRVMKIIGFNSGMVPKILKQHFNRDFPTLYQQ